MEQQKSQFKCEVRAVQNGSNIDFFLPTNSITDLGGCREMIATGAWNLSPDENVVAFDSHNSGRPIGSTRAGSLRLEERADGLHGTVNLDRKITWHDDLYRSVERGDYAGASFGFVVPHDGERWQGDLRIITKLQLIEVSLVSMPAYTKSKIEARQQSNQIGINHMNSNNQDSIVLTGYEARKWREWANETINEPPVFGQVSVEDAPIYRGPYALGQQMLDIAAMSRNGHPRESEARNRFESMIKREKSIAEKRAAGTGGMVEAVGQDGGLLLQGESAVDLITHGFNNSEVLSRATNRDLGTAQFVELLGIDESSRTDGSRGGGVRVYTDKELDLILQSKTKFDKIRLEPKRLTGMYFCSNELLDNAPLLQGEMDTLFREEFAFKGQNLVVNGSGAGEALGIMNAPALVTVAAEGGQDPATIVFENLVKMKARIRRRSRKSLLWIANQDVEPQLFQLALPIGTAGAVMPVYVPSGNQADDGVDGMLMGIPIVFVEQCETLGTVGDLVLGDWSMYYAANKGGVQSASSIHLKFDYNQTAFRFVTYFDGQPRLKAPITPFKGSNTVSPFVALATR